MEGSGRKGSIPAHEDVMFEKKKEMKCKRHPAVPPATGNSTPQNKSDRFQICLDLCFNPTTIQSLFESFIFI